MTSNSDKETDVEHLCKAIYDNGEQYMDGTAAITFSALRIVSIKKLQNFPNITFVFPQGFSRWRKLDKCHYKGQKVWHH